MKPERVNPAVERLFGYDSDGHIVTKDVVQTNFGNTTTFAGGGNQDYIYALGQQLGVLDERCSARTHVGSL